MTRAGMWCGCLAIAVVVGCGGEKSKQPDDRKVVEGGGYSFEVPPGFAIAEVAELQPIFEAGGAVLARSGGDPKKFHGSIVVAPVEGALELDPRDDAQCTAFAAAGAKSLSTELLSAGVVEAAGGKTCQWKVRATEGGKTHAATATVMRAAGERVYVVTCNYDPDDVRAQQGCERVIGGWTVVSGAAAGTAK